MSPCLGQVNSECPRSPKCEPIPRVTQEKLSSHTLTLRRGGGGAGGGWGGGGICAGLGSVFVFKGHQVPRTSTLTSFGAPVNPNFLNHKMEPTATVRT